jgi:hypothetical protein
MMVRRSGTGIQIVSAQSVTASFRLDGDGRGGLDRCARTVNPVVVCLPRKGVVHFKIKTDAAAYQIAIYRMGYYGGLGARRVATIAPSVPLPQTQPACLSDAITGVDGRDAGGTINLLARYVQYRLTLATTVPGQTPVVNDVTLRLSFSNIHTARAAHPGPPVLLFFSLFRSAPLAVCLRACRPVLRQSSSIACTPPWTAP